MTKTEQSLQVDAIALKREGHARIYEETKDMTREEELAYWQQKDAELRERIARLNLEAADS